MIEKVQIEQTSKATKLIRLIGIVFFLLAIVIAALTSDQYGPSDTGLLISSIVGGIGVLIYGIGQIAAWWNHG